MTKHETSHTISWVPCLLGILLWAAATALLLEDAFAHSRFDVATLATPVLTAASVAAACMAHQRFAAFRLIGGLGFAALALLGSAVMATGTLGRLAEATDAKQSGTQAVHRQYGMKSDELKAAKVEQAKECKSIGKRCEAWNARVDVLQKELSSIVVRSVDAKADAIARLAMLLGGNGATVKEIVQATDPVTLPLFLEFGSMGMFAAAFRRRNAAIVQRSTTIAAQESAIVVQPITRAEALADLKTMREAGSGRYLAQRWGVDPSTASRWLQQFEASGAIDRTREGKAKAIAIVAPTRKRIT